MSKQSNILALGTTTPEFSSKDANSTSIPSPFFQAARRKDTHYVYP
jgi:hypothetical protein